MSYAKLQSPLGGSDLGTPSGLRPLSGVEATAEVLTRKGYKAADQLSSRDDVRVFCRSATSHAARSAAAWYALPPKP